MLFGCLFEQMLKTSQKNAFEASLVLIVLFLQVAKPFLSALVSSLAKVQFAVWLLSIKGAYKQGFDAAVGRFSGSIARE